jgi:hypothetical protein
MMIDALQDPITVNIRGSFLYEDYNQKSSVPISSAEYDDVNRSLTVARSFHSLSYQLY